MMPAALKATEEEDVSAIIAAGTEMDNTDNL